jgi:octaprenyl-diphosphate synthase
MGKIDLILQPVASEMKEFNQFFRNYLTSDTRILNIITRYVIKTKGKQMRPLLVFLSARLFDDTKSSAYHAAVLIELMHTATLIHDDVVDDSDKRRGFLSINSVWKNKIAVLVGDYFLAKGLLLSVEKNEYELLRIMSDAVKEMSEGELLQIEKARKLDISEELYLKIIRKKTAVLIASCAAAGTVASGAGKDAAEKMYRFGEALGMAFQIKDDLFDFIPGNKTGKPWGNDLREKKITLPLIYTLSHCTGTEKRQVLRIVNQKKITDTHIGIVVDYINKYKGFGYASKRMDEYIGTAREILSSFSDNEARRALFLFVDYVVSREK